MDKNQLFRMIPKVDVILEREEIQKLIEKHSRSTVTDLIRTQLDRVRNEISSCGSEAQAQERIDAIVPDILEAADRFYTLNMRPVINGTGTILHTNLGRSPVSEEHAERIKEIVTGYCNLEYDLEAGERGERYSHFEDLLCRITGAEAALAVNNNAAAVLLILSTFPKGSEAIVSRGELVEVGGRFRIPEVMEQVGMVLHEVGTTNKTHLSDYEKAIGENTRVLMKVHTSNYRIVGFTEEVSRAELTELAHRNGIAFVEDLGSGVLVDLEKYGLSHEPTVQESVRAGVDVVCFSGDKLLGGPQAGIIVGRKKYIDQMKKNQLLRAIRIDKFSAAALELVLREYLDEEQAVNKIPVLRMISRGALEVKTEAEELLGMLEARNLNAEIAAEPCESQIGGGALPLERIASTAIVIKSLGMTTAALEKALRSAKVPVICRVVNDRILLDARTLFRGDFAVIADELEDILS